MEKKQTAVEWLIEQLEIFATEEEMNIIDQAKEMEKEQIMQAFANGKKNGDKNWAHRYYKQTFKSDGKTLDRDTTV